MVSFTTLYTILIPFLNEEGVITERNRPTVEETVKKYIFNQKLLYPRHAEEIDMIYKEFERNIERVAAILDKVKKGIWFFFEGEEIETKHDFFLHKYGVLSWESKFGSPTPFIAEVEEEETILKPPYDFRGMYDICNVDVGGKCDLFKTNEDHDCIIVNTQFFMQGLELKDI